MSVMHIKWYDINDLLLFSTQWFYKTRGIINVSWRRRIYFSLSNVCHCNSAKTHKEWKFILAKIGKDCLCHCGKFIFPHSMQKIKTCICWNCSKTDRGEKNLRKKSDGKWKEKERNKIPTKMKAMLFIFNNFIFFLNTWRKSGLAADNWCAIVELFSCSWDLTKDLTWLVPILTWGYS